MRRLLLLSIVLLATIPALAQRSPEVDAFLDALFARNISQLARHLPPSVEKAIAEMDLEERKHLEQTLLILRAIEREGARVARVDDGPVLITITVAGKDDDSGEIVLDRNISDGYDALLRVSMRSKPDGTRKEGDILVWMRYLEGGWRVLELQVSEQSYSLKLEELANIPGINQRIPGNESSAVGSLRVYNTAIATYITTYPQSGLPQTLEALGAEEGVESNSSHAGLVDSSLSSPPFEKSGYSFEYRPGASGAYTITARPLEYGKSGNRNFFTDETGIVRATNDDREATKDDPPIN